MDRCKLPRIPTVTISSRTCSSPVSCATTGVAADTPKANATPAASGVLVKEGLCILIGPRLIFSFEFVPVAGVSAQGQFVLTTLSE